MYDPKTFWEERFKKSRMDIRGPGNGSMSVEGNLAQNYRGAAVLCEKFGKHFNGARILDVGIGNGFWIPIYDSLGMASYTGIDITDVLFKELSLRFPHHNYAFHQCDITLEDAIEIVSPKPDIITMIDVTQHIVDPAAFEQAMDNVKNNMSNTTKFIVTSWLSQETHIMSEYQIARCQNDYTKLGFTFDAPYGFRDKYIMMFSKT